MRGSGKTEVLRRLFVRISEAQKFRFVERATEKLNAHRLIERGETGRDNQSGETRHRTQFDLGVRIQLVDVLRRIEIVEVYQGIELLPVQKPGQRGTQLGAFSEIRGVPRVLIGGTRCQRRFKGLKFIIQNTAVPKKLLQIMDGRLGWKT